MNKDSINANLIANKEWNKTYDNLWDKEIKFDDWLDSFKEYIENTNNPIIDLGCGFGNDTLYLRKMGKKVIPCDYSEIAIKNVKENFPDIKRVECFDMTKGLPFNDNCTDVVIADLTLHYFTKEDTFMILDEIKRVLNKGGVLLLRVNSVEDINHGAMQGEEIEYHLFKTSDGRYKRFFDEDDIDFFFKDWKKLYVNEESMKRYKEEKILWKCAFMEE